MCVGWGREYEAQKQRKGNTFGGELELINLYIQNIYKHLNYKSSIIKYI